MKCEPYYTDRQTVLIWDTNPHTIQYLYLLRASPVRGKAFFWESNLNPFPTLL